MERLFLLMGDGPPSKRVHLSVSWQGNRALMHCAFIGGGMKKIDEEGNYMTIRSPTPGYFTRYENLAFARTDGRVLTLRFHTNGGTYYVHWQNPRGSAASAGGDRARPG